MSNDNHTPHDAADCIVEKFDNLQIEIEALRDDLRKVKSAQGVAAKIEALLNYATHATKQTESMYDLLVEMNNFFGTPA